MATRNQTSVVVYIVKKDDHIPRPFGSTDHLFTAWTSTDGCSVKNIPEVTIHVNEICTAITNGTIEKQYYDIQDGKAHNVFRNADLTSVVIGMMKWRRCTGYIVAQLSSRGVRCVVYLDDIVRHNAISFGTSPSCVEARDCDESMTKALEVYKSKLVMMGFPSEIEKSKYHL